MAGIKSLIMRNKLVDTLVNLRGNARACIYTEPLWGLPVNLYMPLAAKYMEALGLDVFQIGLVATTYLLSQVFFSFISGAVTDKLGRRWTTTIFDSLAWLIPFFLWMNARGFIWFMLAAAANGIMRITNNAWSLLMVEDAPKSKLVSIYSLSTIAGLLSGFAAPLTSLFVGKNNLVPTMRWLYLFAFVCMVIKIYLVHTMTTETTLGVQRREELRGKSVYDAMKGSWSVIRQMLTKTPLMLMLGIMSCVMVIRSSTENFWPLLVTGKLGISEGSLPLLSAMKSVVQLVFYFGIAPRLKPRYFFRPMRLGLMIILVLHLGWYVLSREVAPMVYAGVLMEALEMSILTPLLSSLQMLLLDQTERSRMFGFSLTFCLLVTSPFGALNGLLARVEQGLPMLLSAMMAGLALLLLMRFRLLVDRQGLLTDMGEEAA